MRIQKNRFRLGILGGGQLAQMLAIEAHLLGIEPWVFSSQIDDPAAQVTSFWYQGDIHNTQEVRTFLKKVDLATFESEFLDASALKSLEKSTQVMIFPQPELMGQLQDRLTQKQLLQKYKIPSSEFIAVSNETEALLASSMKFPLVFKKRHGGYDGYGTFIFKSEKDLRHNLAFVHSTERGFIAEKFIPFRRELALLAIRNLQGEVVFFPLVETKQKNSRCLWVKGPVSHKAVKSLRRKIKKFLNEMNYVGAIAFELFDCGKELLVNEIAPRVHNSAHYTQEAFIHNQFAMHLLAIQGKKLPQQECQAKGFAMMNLLGEGREQIVLPAHPQCKLHWYGKRENRLGRKMGHINALAKTPDQALKIVLKARKDFKL